MVDNELPVSVDTEQQVPDTTTPDMPTTPAGDEANGILKTAKEVTMTAMPVGVVGALEETKQFFNTASGGLYQQTEDWLNENLVDLGTLAVSDDRELVYYRAGKAIQEAKARGINRDDPRFNDFVKERVEVTKLTDPITTVGGEITSTLSQYAVGLIGVNKFAKGVKPIKQVFDKAGKLVESVVIGSAAEVLAFDETEKRLSNILAENDIVDNAFTRYLSADPSDTKAEAVFKQALEGALTNTVIDSVFLGARAIKAKRQGDANAAQLLQEASEAATTANNSILQQFDTNMKTWAKALNIEYKGYQAAETLRGSRRTRAKKKARDAYMDELPVNMQDDLKGQGRGVVIPNSQTEAEAVANVRRLITQHGGNFEESADSYIAHFPDAFAAEKSLATSGEFSKLAMKNLEQVARAFDNGEASIDEVGAALDRAARLAHHAKGQISGVARALNYSKDFSTDIPTLNTIVERARQLNNDEVAQRSFLGKLHEFGPLIKEAGKKGYNKTVAVVNELFINAILSGPWTHYINVGSNTAVMATRPIERFFGAAFRGDVTEARKALYMYEGLGHASLKSLRGAYQSLKAGKTLLDTPRSTIENMGADNAIPNALGGQIINAPTTLLSVEDELFKQLNFRMAAYAEAAADAKLKGLRGTARKSYIHTEVDKAVDSQLKASAEGLTKPDNAIARVAIEEARVNTFTNDLTGMSKVVQDVIQKAPILRQVAPFVRTPINLWSFFLQRSPFAFLSGKFWKNMGAGGQLRGEALARVSLGSGLAAVYYDMAQNGTLTGSGDSMSLSEKRALQETTGWRPNSWFDEDDGKYKDLSRFSPATDLTNIMATIHELNKNGYYKEADDIFFGVSSVIASYAADKTWLRGLSEAMDVFDFSDEKTIAGNVTEFGKNRTAALIPFSSLLKFFNDDPYLREINEWGENLKKNLPYLSQDMDPRRNWLGEPIEPDDFWGIEALNDFPLPSKTSDLLSDPLAEEFTLAHKLGIPHSVSKLPDNRGGFNLKDPKYTKDAQGNPINPDRTKQTAYDQWAELVSTTDFQVVIDYGRYRGRKTKQVLNGNLRTVLTEIVQAEPFKQGKTMDLVLDDGRVISGNREDLIQKYTNEVRQKAWTLLVGLNPYETQAGKYTGANVTVFDESNFILGFKDERTPEQKKKMAEAEVANLQYVVPKNPVLARDWWNVQRANQLNLTPEGQGYLKENQTKLQELLSGNGRFSQGSN